MASKHAEPLPCIQQVIQGQYGVWRTHGGDPIHVHCWLKDRTCANVILLFLSDDLTTDRHRFKNNQLFSKIKSKDCLQVGDQNPLARRECGSKKLGMHHVEPRPNCCRVVTIERTIHRVMRTAKQQRLGRQKPRVRRKIGKNYWLRSH